MGVVDDGKQKVLAQILDAQYFHRRDKLLGPLIRNILEFGLLEDNLKGFDATKFDERVVEYAYFTSWIKSSTIFEDILDVGNVLNNKLITYILNKFCKNVWLCNPAIEAKIFIENSLYYHISKLSSAFTNGMQFSQVTSLSTIEHIGYDNSQYGSTESAKYYSPNDDVLIESVQKLGTLVNNGGKLLISVPYGYREVLTHPKTFKISSQVFDYSAINKAIQTLLDMGFNVVFDVYKATENGWILTDPEVCEVRYAHGCPAAAAVCFLSGVKNIAS